MAQPTEPADRPAGEAPGHVVDINATHPAPTYEEKKSAERSDHYVDEKGDVSEKGGVLSDDHVVDDLAVDPFKPFDDLPEERANLLTVRAMLIGIIAGALVNASNVYLGLKSGWTFTANLFGAIGGFGTIKFLTWAFPKVPGVGDSFGPRENNIIQTAATAAGGMSNVFVSAFPAIYQLGLMKSPKEDFWKIVTLTATGGYFGYFFGLPLRKFFIVYVARELKLIFPTATATAMTIRSMHDAAHGANIGRKKMKALSIAFLIAILIRVVSQYAPGILWEWHPFTWFYIWGHYKNLAIHVENWGWFIEFTPAFIGSGMLVGLNVAISFFAGSVIAWGIIGPALVHNNVAFGIHPYDEESKYYPKWKESVSFASLGAKASSKSTPSPRYWMLWPGVLAMIAISFTELFLQWRIIWYALRAAYRGIATGLYDVSSKFGKQINFLKVKQQDATDLVQDPAQPHELPAWWMWVPGLLMSIIGMCLVLGLQYGMPVGESVLSVFLAFFFAFLAIQCTGVTDITPLTAASKASQIVLGGATKAEGWPVQKAQRLNLLGGAIANLGANQATDLVADFRVGFLLRTPPNQQFIAQGIATIVAVFLAPLIFQLFMTAYPCVINQTEPCEFSYPSVSAWKATAVAVTDPTFPIPLSSGIFAIVFAVFGCVMVIIRHYLWVGRLEWVRKYHPNMMCISLAFVLPQTFYGTAMVIGSSWAYIWAKKNPQSFDIFAYAIAAGLIAGEGIGGVVNAILQIAGVAGDKYGTFVGCPGECPG